MYHYVIVPVVVLVIRNFLRFLVEENGEFTDVFGVDFTVTLYLNFDICIVNFLDQDLHFVVKQVMFVVQIFTDVKHCTEVKEYYLRREVLRQHKLLAVSKTQT